MKDIDVSIAWAAAAPGDEVIVIYHYPFDALVKRMNVSTLSGTTNSPNKISILNSSATPVNTAPASKVESEEFKIDILFGELVVPDNVLTFIRFTKASKR